MSELLISSGDDKKEDFLLLTFDIYIKNI